MLREAACAHEPALIQADIAHCKANFEKLAANCKTKVTAAHDRARSKTGCTADAKTEPTATAGAFASRASQLQAAPPSLPQ